MAYKEQQPKPLGEVGSKTTYTIKSKGKEELVGGEGDNRPDSAFDKEQLRIGTNVEFEHTKDKDKAKEIAKDHLTESADYYRKLKVMEDSIKKSLGRANSLVKAMKEDSLSEEDMDLKKKYKSKDQQKYMHAAAERGDVPKDVVEEFDEKTKDYKKLPEKVKKALKASAIVGLSRRGRLDAAYRAGVAAGQQAEYASPFATEDLSETPIKIGISEDQTRPSYEPPVVPVRKVNNNPGYIAPKPCGDHEYKTTTTGPSEAKPIKDR